MSINSKEEIITVNSVLNELNDSQKITGTLKDNQNNLQNEFEYNKEQNNDTYKEVDKKPKKKKRVTFKEKSNLVVIIDVESYKKYNNPIEIGPNKNKIHREDSIVRKKRKDAIKKKEMEFDDTYFDK